MKTLFFLLVALCYLSPLHAQQVSRSLISSSGFSSSQKEGTKLSWSIGEVFGKTAENGYYVTEGFQQGALCLEISEEEIEMETLQDADFGIVIENPTPHKIYPTLVSERLFFAVMAEYPSDVQIRLVSQDGKFIDADFNSVEDNVFEISNIGNISSGIYFLQIAINEKWQPAQRFIKM